jgi:hypothetical protein
MDLPEQQCRIRLCKPREVDAIVIPRLRLHREWDGNDGDGGWRRREEQRQIGDVVEATTVSNSQLSRAGNIRVVEGERRTTRSPGILDSVVVVIPGKEIVNATTEKSVQNLPGYIKRCSHNLLVHSSQRLPTP